MEKGKVYGFKSVDSRNEFKNEYLCNKEFSKWLGSHFFRVDALDYDGSVVRVERGDGEYYPSKESTDYVIAEHEYHHFTEINTRPVSWEAGKTYRLQDAESFSAHSNINETFLRLIGFCPFNVLCIHEGAAGIKTRMLEYVDEDNVTRTLVFSLTKNELAYFTAVDTPLTRGWIRGAALIEGIANKTMSNSHGELFIGEEFYDQSPETSEFKVKGSGSFEFTVTDEASRLKAISFLQTLEFK